MLNYDRRLAPSHPKPREFKVRKVPSVRASLQNAILHADDHFHMTWVINTLVSKIDEELKANDFVASDEVYGVVHVLLLQHKQTTVIKVGSSSYPRNFFGHTGTPLRYKKCLAPLTLKKVEAVHLYPTRDRAQRVEQELHRQLRHEYGNVTPFNLKAIELYESKHLEAILVRLRESEHRIETNPQEMQSRPSKKGNTCALHTGFLRQDRKTNRECWE